MVDEEPARLVFSHRRTCAHLSRFTAGDVVGGVVLSIKPYGAFVDIGGDAAGLLHISQISRTRLVQVEQVLAVGDQLKALVVHVDEERGRLKLSTKALEPAPGDMLRNKQLVFERAEETAAAWRAQRKER